MSIVLIPIGAVDRDLLAMLRERLERVLADVVIGEGIPLPASAWNAGRDQYAAGALLQRLARAEEVRAHGRALGITDADLYVPGLNFVFGLASGRAGVISLHRLRPSFYHLPDDRELFHRRALVEAVHELGHTFGLAHCPDPGCVMFFSSSITDTDRKGPEFCEHCHPEGTIRGIATR